MQLYTAQIGKESLASEIGVPFIDTTVKSGWRELAPRWDMVMGHKNNDPLWNDAAYTAEFHRLMEISLSENPQFWGDLLHSESVCLGCYCRAGKFCHRRLLIDILRNLCALRGIDFEYCGELS